MPSVDVANVLGKPPGEPTLADKYELDKELGKGAFGVVHLAKAKQTGEKVAVKSLSKAKLVCPEDLADVQGEVAIMNMVGGHPHVVMLKSTHEDKENVHLVMELCSGGELFDAIVSSGKFTEKQAAEVFKSMVEVIKHCHEMGVVHRDLKPENFLLTSKAADAALKLTDFGLSTFFKPGERFKDLVGSPYYVAPEVLRKDYDQSADIWSLGVILYILLSGLPPFWGNTEEEIFGMVLKGHVPFENSPWDKISDAAKDCIKQCLTMDAKKRPTAQQLLQHPWLVKEGVAPDTALDSEVLSRMKQFAQMNKLKKMALMVVGQSLAPDELEGLQQLFRSFDQDGSGHITVDELKKALHSMGHKIHESELREVMEIADVDGSGTMDYHEFVAATMHISKLEKEEVTMKAFKELDKDGSGTISLDELAEALGKFGITDDAEKLLESADQNKDGLIDYAEFCFLLRSNNQALQSSARTKAKGLFSRFF